MNLQKLSDPFEPNDIEFRAGATTKDKTKALALPYITSRGVMDRLDSVVGPENWRDEYREGPQGGVLCGISIRLEGEWICKWDGADNTQIESVKGGLSDAFKRAAVKWGIGRYLYTLPAVWVKAEQRGKSVTIDEAEARRQLFGKANPKRGRDVITIVNRPTPVKNGNGTSRQDYINRIRELEKEIEFFNQSVDIKPEFLEKASLEELTEFGKGLGQRVNRLRREANKVY